MDAQRSTNGGNEVTITRGKFTTNIDIDHEDDVEVQVTWEGFYRRAKISGPPECCHPAEGEMELVSVKRTDDWSKVHLLSSQEERLLDLAWEDYHSE